MIDASITFDQPAFDPSETYTLQQDGSVMRGSDSASIPADAGNAAYRAFLAWQASGKTPAPVPAPPFSAGSVKAECGRRIYAVASDNAQKNMLATIVADGMSAVDKATFAAGVTWIAAMQATSSSAFHTYEASLGSDLSDTRRNRWEGGGKTVTGDGLYTDIKTTLGWTTLQMTTLYTLAATITG